FLSIAVTKRQAYLMPAHAAAALMLAPYLAAVGGAAVGRPAGPRPAPDARPVRWLVAALAVVLLLVGACGLIASIVPAQLLDRLPGKPDDLLHTTLLDERWPIALLSAVGLAGGLWMLRAWRAGDQTAALARTAAIQVPIYLLVSGLVLPALNPIRTYA